MPKEDYLIKYIEKLHRVIAAMLGLKESGKGEQVMEIADEALIEYLGLSVQDIMKISEAEFEKHIRLNNYGVTFLEKICELFVVLTDTCYDLGKQDQMRDVCKKALILYRLLNEKDKTFSFERESIISELEEISKNQITE
jgi:hypothetical protein